MEVQDFQNFDGSEDEAEDAAELEAHLYSKIYYQNEETSADDSSGRPSQRDQTSMSLYTETKVRALKQFAYYSEDLNYGLVDLFQPNFDQGTE